jgi:glutamate-5-semialdehyde dehydrogenase
MLKDWLQQLRGTKVAANRLAKANPALMAGIRGLSASQNGNGALDPKTRELIALAVAVTTRCDSCIAVHASAARAAGVTEAELSDALGTATAIMEHAVRPALRGADLPEGAVRLVESEAHAAGWALFADARVGLAVARGSGRAVAQLGAVARQHGVPVSLHGTGGAWMIVDADAAPDVVHDAVLHSLDRKVCNTLNVCCVVADGAATTMPVVLAAAAAAAAQRNARLVLHATASSTALVPDAALIEEADLGTEWEWEDDPELSLVIVPSVDAAVELFNRFSPRFAASLVGGDEATWQRFYDTVDAPFVGNGFTRWVDGQFAFRQPELGLSNWQSGRLFARGGVLSGDSVFTVRTVATVRDHGLHR